MATPETTPITENEALKHINADYTERYGFHDAENYLFKAPKGLSHELVAKISEFKSEPQWMRDFRLKALEHFLARPQPTWGSPLLNEVDYDNIHYFVRASERAERSWDDVPEDVKKTFDRLGIPEAERTFLIADEGSYVHYVEGCTAPTYSSDSLHSAVVELIAKPGARIRYTTVQNWSQNVFNLVTKRAVAHEDATVEWVDCNLGSKLTMKYPSIYLMGERAHGEVLSIAFAGAGQHQDAGAKIIHAAPNTTSNIFAKSISKDGGRGSYRGLLEIAKGAHGARSKVVCDALLLDEHSRSDTYPTIRISEDDVNVAHEATVSKVGEDQLFYLMSHGIPEDEAGERSGTFVYVPRGVAVEAPIALTATQERAGTLVNHRTLIVVEEGAQAEVWEQFLSAEDDLDGVFNIVTELIVGDNAHLRYI